MKGTKQEVIEEINKIPLFVKRRDADDDNGTWVESPDWKAITEADSLKPLVHVTNKYNLIQMRDIFIPLINPIPDLEGEVRYYKGIAVMTVFPKDDALKDESGRIGLAAWNSVNESCSVIIKFCLLHNGRVYTFPHRIAGYKRVHSGKAIDATVNYLSVVDRIRGIWTTILTGFQKMPVDRTFADSVFEQIEIKSQFLKNRVYKAIDSTQGYNLWDLFNTLIIAVDEKKSKTDYHQKKKNDLIVEKMFKFAIAARLINA